MTVRLALRGGAVELLDLRPERAGAVLVLLHEGLGSVGLWRGFPELLAAATGLRTVAFSRYGHGQSDPPPAPRTPTFMHEEALVVLPEVLDELGIDAPVLVGHSDGGSIALIHAGHSRTVRGVVAIAPHVFVEELALAEIRLTREAYLAGALRERMGRHHRDPDAAFHGWNDVWLNPEFAAWNLLAEVSRITCPLLLIQGEQDAYGTMAQLDAVERAAVGAASVQRIELQCGHSPPVEMPAQTGEAIAGWVAQLLG